MSKRKREKDFRLEIDSRISRKKFCVPQVSSTMPTVAGGGSAVFILNKEIVVRIGKVKVLISSRKCTTFTGLEQQNYNYIQNCDGIENRRNISDMDKSLSENTRNFMVVFRSRGNTLIFSFLSTKHSFSCQVTSFSLCSS